jgi:hypothetical protein
MQTRGLGLYCNISDSVFCNWIILIRMFKLWNAYMSLEHCIIY